MMIKMINCKEKDEDDEDDKKWKMNITLEA